MRRFLVAPDAFKGTLSAAEVAAALAQGLREGGAEAVECPVADGGEGTIEALSRALPLELRESACGDPLGRPVRARWALLEPVAARPESAPASLEGVAGVPELAPASLEGVAGVPELAPATAILEMASVSGLALLAEQERDAERASSAGTGELLLAARAGGAERALLAIGGTATSDGGAGAVAVIEAAGGLRGMELELICDVSIPFERAAEVFGPQKGASAAGVERLTRRLHELAASWPRDPRGLTMTGAGGGLAGAMWALYEARLRSGSRFVLEALGFERLLDGADAVIVGEGCLDGQSRRGKIAGEILDRACARGVPVHAVVGSVAEDSLDGEWSALASTLIAGTPQQLREAGAALAR